MMKVWFDGIRRVNRAPVILAGVWVMTLLVSLPLTLALRDTIARHLGASLAADRAASGVDYDWMQEFSEVATGSAVTFRPTILGYGPYHQSAVAHREEQRRMRKELSVEGLAVTVRCKEHAAHLRGLPPSCKGT